MKNILKSLILPFVLLWKIISWPFSLLSKEKRRFKSSYGPLAQEVIPCVPISAEQELGMWCSGKETRDVISILADILPEGILDTRVPQRTAVSCYPYRINSYTYPYEKYVEDGHRTVINVKSWSRSPVNKKVKNNWRWRLGVPDMKEQLSDD